MKRGKFISLEGGEGAGKSTQARALAADLRARGLEVVLTREPGGSPGAEAIRQLLLEGKDDRWTLQAEALLFAAARADHIAKTIRPALERGAWVISDRFLDSSIAYQGIAGGMGAATIRHLHQIGSGGFLPDRTFFLTLDAKAAAQRARARDGNEADRIGGRDGAYHEQVARGFSEIAREEPDRVRIVDASGTAAEVTGRLLLALADLL